MICIESIKHCCGGNALLGGVRAKDIPEKVGCREQWNLSRMFRRAWVCVGYAPSGKSKVSEGPEVDESEVCLGDQGKFCAA